MKMKDRNALERLLREYGAEAMTWNLNAIRVEIGAPAAPPVKAAPEAPIVNLNGTSPDSLIEAYTEAGHAMRAAALALAMTAPNGRDWQTSRDPEAFKRAQAQHVARVRALDGILMDLQDLAVAVDDQR